MFMLMFMLMSMFMLMFIYLCGENDDHGTLIMFTCMIIYVFYMMFKSLSCICYTNMWHNVYYCTFMLILGFILMMLYMMVFIFMFIRCWQW